MGEYCVCKNYEWKFPAKLFWAKKIVKASLKDLVIKKVAIEKVFDKNVYIDLYKTSIRETIYYNKRYLSFGSSKNDTIKCKLKNLIDDNVLEDVNSSLPEEIKDKYLEELAC